MKLTDLNIDKSWTLFLDRDGVINRRIIDDYVRNIDEFEFLESVPESIAKLANLFGVIVVVTNQQGIGKKWMTESDLESIHQHMVKSIEQAGGRIDKIYHCPMLKTEENNCRKPLPAMGYAAKNDFPNIDFSKSVMVGDSISDMEFGKALGMFNVFITDEPRETDGKLTHIETTNLLNFTSLLHEI